MTMDEETFLGKILPTKRQKSLQDDGGEGNEEPATPPLGEGRYLHSGSDLRDKCSCLFCILYHWKPTEEQIPVAVNSVIISGSMSSVVAMQYY